MQFFTIVGAFSKGDLDFAIRLASMVDRGQVLAPVLDPADRAADMPGGKRDQGWTAIPYPGPLPGNGRAAPGGRA